MSRSKQIRRKAVPATVGRAARQAEKCPKFVALARCLTPPGLKVTFHNGNFGRARTPVFHDDDFGRAIKRCRIFVPYLTTVDDLQIYLHELGHVLDWWQGGAKKAFEPQSESEFRAEAYAFRMMRRAGISLPREGRRTGIAYVGWHVVDDVLNDRGVSAEALTFVALKGVHRLTIIRAQSIAIERIGYLPKHQRHGKLMTPPADTNYWSAVLAAVPSATLSTAAEIKRYEWGQKVMRDREEEWAGEGSIHYGDYWGD